MEPILKDWKTLARALILFVVLAISIYFIITGVFQNINSVSDISIETNEKGGFIIKVAKKTGEAPEQYAQFLLPSNNCWYNTGLEIKPDEEYNIRITGKVHLAFNKLIRDLDSDQITTINWTGPDGENWAKLGDDPKCEEAKRKLLIVPGDKIGNVVGYVSDQKMPDEDFIKYFLDNRKEITKQIEIVNENATIKSKSKNNSILYLSVNDILIDTTNEVQEELSKYAFEGRKNKASKWDKIKISNEYYRLWFDDNVGGFLVSVTIKKKQ